MRTKLCVLAFLATGAAVYLMAAEKVGRPEGDTTTATITHRFAPSGGPAADDSAAMLPRPDPARIEQQILSDASLRRALGSLAPAGNGRAGDVASAGPAESPGKVRSSLRVVAVETASPDQLRISISSTDPDRDRALRLVNNLAEQYAEQSRAALEGTLGRSYLEARSAAELAHRALLEAKKQLEAFLAGHFENAPAETAPEVGGPVATTTPAAGPAAPAPAAASPSRIIDNPEWVELDRQLTDLQRQRAELLVERMPVHPEVQDIDVRIAGLRERLASVPMQIVEEPGEGREDLPAAAGEGARQPPLAQDPSTTPAQGDSATGPRQHAEAARQFWAKKGASDRAQQTWDRLALEERRAWEEQMRVPRIDVQLAEAAEISESADSRPRVLLVALIAGLAMAAGVGMLWSGFAGDSPLVTLAQAQAALPVPIVGAIAATGPSEAETAGWRLSHAGRRAMILYGTLLIAICFAILLVVFW